MTTSPVRLAADIGGTFTDLALEVGGARHTTKVLTTHAAPERALIAGTETLLAEAGIAFSDVTQVIHGTTLATNAIIERKGAVTALIATQGFRDTLAIADESRFDQYDVLIEKPEPLVPRHLRFTVPERVDVTGAVWLDLDEAAVATVVDRIAASGAQSVAVALMHAYAFPAHEQRIREMLTAALPDVSVTLSCEVCPEIREYERTSTAVANAYVQPMMSGYLARLETELASRGSRAAIALITSGGTLTGIDTARKFPIRLVESGPAGGATLAAGLASERGENAVLSFDMGGTTAKICIIEQGEPLKARSFEVDRSSRFMKGSGLPVRIPVIEMVEIGAGGGSIARIDALGRVRVGPRSAGSEPGPASYGRGGTLPTVTDADLVLGRIDPVRFAGGRIGLDAELARQSIAEHLGEAGDGDAGRAAVALCEVVDENMANAARVHAIERGVDIAGCAMVAFGGAAPLHAARLAQKLGISRIIVPPDAGVGSAIGFLESPAAFEIVRSRHMRLDAFDAETANGVLAEIEAEARALAATAASAAAMEVTRTAFMRYTGQGHEIAVPIAHGTLDAESAATLRAAFEREYDRLFARHIPDARIEVMSWAVAAGEPRARRGRLADVAAGRPADVSGEVRRVIDTATRSEVASAVLDRAALQPGDRIAGPCIVMEAGTSTIVPPGFTGFIDAGMALVLTADAAAAAGTAAGSKTGESPLDDIALQILWNRFLSIVEEQAQVLLRTAFSPIVREAGDLSAGLFDVEGRMLAQAVTGTPGHVNSMAESVKHFIAHFRVEHMRPGDVYITNDPWMGTGHTNDFVVTTPCFLGDRLVGMFSCTSHLVDIGGIGFGPDATDVFMEGLHIPFLKLFDEGQPNETLFAMIRANTRLPVDTIGDVYSLANCNEIGRRRLIETMIEFGLETLEPIADHICARSEAAVRERIAVLPNGVWHYEMTVDGYEAPVDLRAALTVSDDEIVVDFDGTSAAQGRGVNVPLAYTTAYTVFGLACAISPDVPNNAGSLAPFRVTAPRGTILNAPKPAPVLARHITGQMLPDMVFGCLRQVVPDRVPAEGTSCLFNITLRGRVEGEDGASYGFATTFTSNGGTGARPQSDGLSATAFPSGVKGTPVEIAEQIMPVMFWRKELRQGSGGSGRMRGGLGQVIEIASRIDQPFELLAAFDRLAHPPRGAMGGSAGAAARVRLQSGRALAGKGTQAIPPGDRLVIETPGGGGLGNAADRPAERADEDARDELL